ncbi:hypothetical protein RSAG8_13984, partial [Rhizoctonia solani AG-8 WAC10335]
MDYYLSQFQEDILMGRTSHLLIEHTSLASTTTHIPFSQLFTEIRISQASVQIYTGM